MSSEVSYDYATGDLLEARNTYFYTKFQGESFLKAWCKQRDQVLLNVGNTLSSTEGGAAITATDELLNTLFDEFSENQESSKSIWMLNQLLQRFEVTKRLHAAYNENWRPVDLQEYHCIDRYVRFAEVLDLAYAATTSLPYLNALLKCMDTLTALTSRLSLLQRYRLKQLVQNERKYVVQLALRLGLKNHVA